MAKERSGLCCCSLVREVFDIKKRISISINSVFILLELLDVVVDKCFLVMGEVEE
jgi:hypothetical protein